MQQVPNYTRILEIVTRLAKTSLLIDEETKPLGQEEKNELDVASSEDLNLKSVYGKATSATEILQGIEERSQIQARVPLAIQRFESRVEVEQAPRFKIVPAQYMAAAFLAAVLILSTTIILKRPKVPNTLSKIKTNDVAPGGPKAILTLGNGQRITLDSLNTGLVAVQGSTKIIKMTNGQLRYITSDAKATISQFNTIETPEGGTYEVVLPDGSNVWLNSGSYIRFANGSAKDKREVFLDGEAYFEIVHGQTPFVVHTRSGTIEDLGTEFNLNTYTNEPVIKATLIKGSIRVKTRMQSQILKPGQEAQMKNNGDLLVSEGNIEEATAWKSGMFHFEFTGLYSTMRQISRWYRVKIVYEGNVPDKPLLGTAPRNTSLSTILHLLIQEGVHCKLIENTIIITA